MKQKSISQLKKELDKYFSLFVRQKNATSEGLISCYTCGAVDHWKRMDCGHYWSRKHTGTRWEIKNCKPQCKKCNIFGEGCKPQFTLALLHEYSPEVLTWLEIKAKSPAKYDRFELQKMIDDYKRKVKNLG